MLFRKRKPVPAPQSVRSDLQRHQQLMANDICDRLRFLREHVHPNPSSELPVIIADSFDYVTEMSKALIRLGKESERTADEKSGKHRYVVSSRLLMDAWRYLTADQEHRERMAPVIGFVMPDGTNERSLAVATIQDKQVTVISPAPQNFGSAGF